MRLVVRCSSVAARAGGLLLSLGCGADGRGFRCLLARPRCCCAVRPALVVAGREILPEARQRGRDAWAVAERFRSRAKFPLVDRREIGYHNKSLLREQRIAGVAELADAYGSGPYGGNPMEVQVLSPAPLATSPSQEGFFIGLAPARHFHETSLGITKRFLIASTDCRCRWRCRAHPRRANRRTAERAVKGQGRSPSALLSWGLRFFPSAYLNKTGLLYNRCEREKVAYFPSFGVCPGFGFSPG